MTAFGSGLKLIDGETLQKVLPPVDAVDAIEAALIDGLDPEADPARVVTGVPSGELLLMPAHSAEFAGVKIATVAPGNTARGLSKIQGLYLLFDSATLAPLAVMDGAELTLIRTPAVTITALKHLLAAGAGGLHANRMVVNRMVVIGTSAQAWAHIRSAVAVLDIGETVVIGRRANAAEKLASRAVDAGYCARAGGESDIDDADVIVCATSSRTPVFDGARVKPSAVVAAIGSHGLDARELDANLARRADVVVEGRASALCEAGDLIPARSVEEWARIAPPNLADLVAGKVPRRADSPALYTGVGMSWEDLVLAARAYTIVRDGVPQ